MADGITITIHAESKAAAQQLEEFFGGVKSKINELTGVGDFLQGLGAKILAAFTLGAIVEEFKHAVDSAEEFGKAVEKTGLSIPALNGLRIMANENRVSFDSLVLSLTLFNDRIYAAVRSGGDMMKIFRDLKVQITDNKGALLSTETILGEVMDRFHEMPDGIQKTADAQELFGRASRELIPILNEGSSALERMKAHGGGITADEIAKARAFNVALSELREEVDNVARRILIDAVPALKQFIDYLKDGILASETGHFADFFELSMKAAIQDVSNFFSQEIAKWTQQLDAMMNKTGNGEQPGFWSKTGNAVAGVGTGLLALWDQFGAKIGVPGQEEQAQLRIEQANKFFEKAGIADGILVRAADAYVEGTKGLPNEYRKALQDLRDKMHKESPAAADQKSAGAAREKPAAGTAAAGEGAPLAFISDEGKKLIEDIEKQWREATQGKLALLDQEKEQVLKKLKDEFDSAVRNEQVYNEERLKVEQTFAAKRRAIEDEQADHAAKARMDNIRGRIDLVDKNPDLTEAERKRQLLPLLEQERQLLQSILFLKTGELDQSDRSDDDKQKLRDQIAELKKQLADLQADKSKVSQTPWDGMIRQLQQQNDLQKEVAQSFSSAFNTAISSVGSNLTAVIMKTETWRKALLRIGETIMTTIINSIIQMGVRWVMTQVMMAMFGRTLATQSLATDAGIAEAESDIWATPATLATIASFSAAADEAPGAIAGAIGMTEALSALSGFASGGLVTGPGDGTSDSVLAKLSRGEFVIPADRVDQIGVGALEVLRATGDMAAAIPHSLTKPYYQTAEYQQQQAEAAAQPGAAASGGVTVKGHTVTLIQPSNRQEMLDALASSEGQKIVLNHVKSNKYKVGVGT